ncbi:MAG: J domain-containing protein [Deltaproteobacteria bacterium]|nr:J domain-containing protein [Deltaproteobacteria bacterium]
MDPYFILGISPDAGDEVIQARYRELVIGFPPDKAPDRFTEIRQAYESVRTERARIKTHLFRFDPLPDMNGLISRLKTTTPRKRLTPKELAGLFLEE